MHFVISIPYGAIKSGNDLAIVDYNVPISIPYGAIKSISNVENIYNVNKFQFLMVRLKVMFVH